MNAITFLINEHNQIRRAFKNISKKYKQFSTKKKKFRELCLFLIRHETMEQKVWYPHFKKNKKLSLKVKHLITEEKKAATIIKTFKTLKTQEAWENKFYKLKDDVEHHANEEEKKLFPNVASLYSEEELDTFGKALRKFKQAHKLKTIK